MSCKFGIATGMVIGIALTGAFFFGYVLLRPITQLRKQYWATSLTRQVDEGVLQGLNDAVARGDVGWLDIDPKSPLPDVKQGINLILYHVGGNCYIKGDCNRFPSSQPTNDRWGETERMIDLNDAESRGIVIGDLVKIIGYADKIAPDGSTIGAHLDNVHRLDARNLAVLFNELLREIEAARDKGFISKTRRVGYIAKNNPRAFKEALDRGLLDAIPLYQINENARLTNDGKLDQDSVIAQEVGRQYCIPVFLKTFGSDIAYSVMRENKAENVHVSEEMTSRIAQLPYVSGAAWSVDEGRYHPTLFVQGSPVRQWRTPFSHCGN